MELEVKLGLIPRLCSSTAQSTGGARGHGFALKEQWMGEESRAGRHESSWLGWDTLPRPPAPGMGLMSLSEDVGPQAAGTLVAFRPQRGAFSLHGPLDRE